MNTPNVTQEEAPQPALRITFQATLTVAAETDDYVPTGIPGRLSRAYAGRGSSSRRRGRRSRTASAKRRACQDCTHCRWNAHPGCSNPNRRAGLKAR